MKCAVINSTAIFSDAVPEKEISKISKFKESDPAKYEKLYKKIEKEWAEKLKTIPYYDRNTIGDASETALIKFF